MKVLALAFALGAGLAYSAHAAPFANDWDCETTVIYADTVGTLSSDSVATTTAVNVFGARYVLVTVKSSGSDSLTAQVIQVRLPGSTDWLGNLATSFIPFSGGTTNLFSWSTTSAVATSRTYWSLVNETTIPGSGDLPLANDGFRFRLKSTNARRISGTTLGQTPSGTITVTAYVWR